MQPAVLIAFLVLACSSVSFGFLTTRHSKATVGTTLWNSVAENDLETALDVVLFGIGDLRTHDHEGLWKAIESASNGASRVLPLAILDEKSLSSIPGAVAHSIDTASIVAEALLDLNKNLQKLNLSLNAKLGGKSLPEELVKVLQSYSDLSTIRVHVCDHGDADNQMGYAPISQATNLPSNVKVCAWTCHLREEPWKKVESLPVEYPDYASLYQSTPTRPFSVNRKVDEDSCIKLSEFDDLPHTKQIFETISRTMSLEDHVCVEEVNTGLYATHWGGLAHASVGESNVLETIRSYVDDCKENDEIFAKLPLTCERNKKSLEHATMVWNLRGDSDSNVPNSKNIIAGEQLNRYLLAPLLLGTVSPRELWHSSKLSNPLFKSPIKTLVETREWHKLLAAKNIRTDPSYRGEASLNYGYWRWHGFLCRYAESSLTNNEKAEKEGILFIHGFGASGSQWSKSIKALKDVLDQSTNVQCLAPDLIGFGQSEKPPITYCGYNWEVNMNDFIKEIAIAKCNWSQFSVGGNSIGGFVGICAAANDATVDKHAVSGAGAPGTGRCTGAVLMNSAGVIQSKEEVFQIESVTNDSLLKSVAQITATDSLSPSKPLPRPVARAFGEGLLAYLRPRIQSICVNLYPTNPDAVDSNLCNDIRRDSLDPGAINVMISGSKLPTPRTYNEVIAADFGQTKDQTILESTFKGPILVAQGILDPLNDAKGRAEMLGSLRTGVKTVQLHGGHCPHDEVPEDVAGAIAEWLKETAEHRKEMLHSAGKAKETQLVS